MQIIADLHIHSKYARATSPNSDLNGLSNGAQKKGIHVLGTGDFTHPNWFKELKLGLDNHDNTSGVYDFNNIKFLLSAEVSNIFELNSKTKKMHHILLAPDFEIASQINDVLFNYGNLEEDGRPMLKLSSSELIENMMSLSRNILIIPAHIWTPWFSVLGSKNGVDTLKQAYAGMEKYIYALETGLSSDPAMNWMLSTLDRYTLISNSDSHSPGKLGREANVFELEKIDYISIINAIKTKKGFVKTYEFFPEEGKYHYDGHRKCGVFFSPWESKKTNNLCPICKKKLTIGVMHRVVDLADRKFGEKPKDAIPFTYIVPLTILIGKALGKGETTKEVYTEYDKLIQYFGSEFAVYEASEEQLRRGTSELIADAIAKVNAQKVEWIPGYDGVFGELILNKEVKLKNNKVQKQLQDFF